MQCAKCTTELPPDATACTACGTPVDARTTERAKREIYRLLNEIADLMRNKQYDDAAVSCLRVIELAPNSPYAFATLGDIRSAQARLPEAIEAYRAAIRLRPKRLAEIQLKLDEAIDLLTKGRAPVPPMETVAPITPVTPVVAVPPSVVAPASPPPLAPASAPAQLPLPPASAEAVVASPASTGASTGTPVAPPTAMPVEGQAMLFPGENEPIAEDVEVQDDSGAAEVLPSYITPSRARLIITLSLLIAMLSLLFALAPWKKHYRPPAKAVPIELAPDEGPAHTGPLSPLPVGKPQ